ncbi:MAG: hypothetical protein HY511_07825 [Actinobacteria bacterium]|nr:hypothetical protein [Actinomycetota bacterium]
MSELEPRLHGVEIEWPETPALAAAVERRLAAAAPPRRARRRALVLALAALAVALAATLAVPGARSAFLELFHLKGASVQVVEELPPVVPSTSLDRLGEKVSLAEARRRAGFDLVEPEALGEPDAVRAGDGGMVSFVYGEGLDVRMIFSQARGRTEPVFLKKLAGGGTVVEQVTVSGERGLFISGDPHFFYWVGEDGSLRDEPVYLARDVLLWQRGRLLLRLEGELTLERALAVARSVR